ncbi:fatty acid desaturase [Kamptonema sp. UHCC 0994]|uniref:fatty acid desaturase n=1 Tax=Kamptonema sp. UHCC 0994 TaxID=3031329 RepID=UPI0023B976BB|nr:fatty acid desaturase [Kamptonema sp. UHCC 0994]MDF0552246.1 fatty acid desaturase [Kamptonema sp. UHCC 0994]
METTVKKFDFVLTPYMRSNDLWATYQIINTLVPYLLLWFLAVKAASISFWLLPPIVLLIVLFSVRCFSLMHDCGHYSLFSSKKVNRVIGFILGVINAIPQYPWSRDHAYHHKTNGDWERYRGIADFLSTDEFSKLNSFDQRLYELLRHPLMAFPGGFFYLAIKPRIALIAGTYDFVLDLFTRLKTSPGMSLSEIISAHKSKHWYTVAEFWDLLFNNICVVSGLIIFSYLLGPGFFLSMYSIILTFSAAIVIWVFFVEHNFDGCYAHKTADWSYIRGAIEGSTYLELPTILKWFTADIGYHNIHHLSERIPNYNLEACHNENIHLLSKVKTIRLDDMLDCSKFILWDTDSNRLVSIASFRQAAQSRALGTEQIGLRPTVTR